MKMYYLFFSKAELSEIIVFRKYSILGPFPFSLWAERRGEWQVLLSHASIANHYNSEVSGSMHDNV